jgi:hypothetical protein
MPFAPAVLGVPVGQQGDIAALIQAMAAQDILSQVTHRNVFRLGTHTQPSLCTHTS